MRHVATKQTNTNSITQSKNSTPKHLVPCPYLRNKAAVEKAQGVIFPTSLTLNSLLNPANVTMLNPRSRRKCHHHLPGFPPVMNLPTYPFVPQLNEKQNVAYPFLSSNLPIRSHYPPPLMIIPTWPPLPHQRTDC